MPGSEHHIERNIQFFGALGNEKAGSVKTFWPEKISALNAAHKISPPQIRNLSARSRVTWNDRLDHDVATNRQKYARLTKLVNPKRLARNGCARGNQCKNMV